MNITFAVNSNTDQTHTPLVRPRSPSSPSHSPCFLVYSCRSASMVSSSAMSNATSPSQFTRLNDAPYRNKYLPHRHRGCVLYIGTLQYTIRYVYIKNILSNLEVPTGSSNMEWGPALIIHLVHVGILGQEKGHHFHAAVDTGLRTKGKLDGQLSRVLRQI